MTIDPDEYHPFRDPHGRTCICTCLPPLEVFDRYHGDGGRGTLVEAAECDVWPTHWHATFSREV
jgi:hypothetical protein